MSTTDSVAVDHGDDRLWQSADLHLHIEHIQAWHTVSTDISTASLDVHVATRAECLVAGARKNHHTYVEMIAAIGKGLTHLPHGKRCEGVAVAWTVDGDLSDVIVFFKEYLLEVKTRNGFPISLFHIIIRC